MDLTAPSVPQQVHIVMFIYPIPGRLIPAMVLASRLVDHGAKVSFLCPAHRISLLSEAKSRGYRSDIQIVELKVVEKLLDAFPDTPFRDMQVMGILSTLFHDYLESLPYRPSCFIGDEVCKEVVEAALRFNLKWYCFVPQSALALSATLYVRKLEEDSLLPLQASQETFVNIPSLGIPLRTSEYHSPYVQDMHKDSLLLTRLFKQCAILMHQANAILINTFEELEPSILAAARDDPVINPHSVQVLTVGPLIPTIRPPVAEEEAKCNMFLNSHSKNSVVFASFGSLWKCSKEQAMAVYDGLEASGFPYIWMARTDTGYIPKSGENGLILSTWAPQLQILSHDSTGLFMTHSGWNSTLESISCGVPMLVTLPKLMDQMINCKLTVDVLKVGIRLTLLEKNCIADSIKTIMNSQDILKRSQELKVFAKEATYTAHQNIRSIVGDT